MRPQSLDELHQRAQAAVASVIGARSFAAARVLVADLPARRNGHDVTGQFQPFSPGLGGVLAQARGFRRALIWFWIAIGRRFRSGQITLLSSYEDALSPLWRAEHRLAVNRRLMNALATLIHEEFHAINQDWSWLVADRIWVNPAVARFGEGIVELGVEEFLPAIFDEMRLGGLRTALILLQSRRAYVAEKEAARALVTATADLLGTSRRDLLKQILANGGQLIALRTLAHEVVAHTGRKDRLSEPHWYVARFQRTLPACAEASLVDELLRPFVDLDRRAA